MRLFFLSILFFSAFFSSASGQDQPSLFDLLVDKQDIQISLTYTFDSLYRTQREEIDAVISIDSHDGQILENAPLKLNLRGKFRRMKCVMPPLKLNFKKSTLRNLGVSEIDDIKLVTHCMEGKDGQEDIDEELLCYKVYETLSPYAFRTVRVNIIYRDKAGKYPAINSGAFLIEPDKVLETRLRLDERKRFSIAEDSLDFSAYASAAAFNFLIGNKDWSITESRNTKLFYNPDTGKYIAVPYDFDFSNVVIASYRREVKSPGSTHPLDRVFKGEYFADRSAETLTGLLQHEKEILRVVMEADCNLSKDRRKKIAKYFSDCFQYIRTRNADKLKYGMVLPYQDVR